ncbi:HNH endonuclease [Candidatus Latescibacterota bacterium]
MLNSNVLLLNQNFIPLTVCTAKHAVVMVWSGRAEIVESTGKYIHSVSRRFDVPSIIRLLVYVKISYRFNIQLTKQNIIKRDRGVCQYCGNTEGSMTVDHVVPRSHGGDESWGNLVCACSKCNNQKDDKTPQEAGMELLKKPKKPNIASFLFSHKIQVQNSWNTFLKIK